MKKLKYFLILAAIACAGSAPYNPGDPVTEEFFQTRVLECFITGCGARPTIANLHNNGLIETGFVVGTASSEIQAVQVSVNDSVYQAATGSTNWSFALPTGFATLRRNTSNLICARGLVNGLPTSPACITATKGENRDVNGDGYPDLITGTQSYDGAAGADTGAFFILYGRASGLSTGTIALADVKIEGPAASDRVGQTVGLADVNGDGYGDAIAAAPSANGFRGEVYVFHGGASGIASGTSAAASSTIVGAVGGDAVGTQVSAGDLNGDGFADLVISGTQVGGGRGAVYVFAGSDQGITSGTTTDAITTVNGENASDELGNHLNVQGFDNDGLMDLLIGSNEYVAVTLGRVYGIKGTVNGLGTVNASTAPLQYTGGTAADELAIPIGIGDFDGDGIRDFALGAEGANRAYVLPGTTSGFTSATISTADFVFNATGGNNMSRHSYMRDVNGDGRADLLVGNLGFNAGLGASQGAIFIFHGRAGSASLTDIQADSILAGAAAGNQLARHTVLDINGDGFQDLVASSIQAMSNRGQIYIFLGSAAGFPASVTAASADITITGEITTDFIGFSFD